MKKPIIVEIPVDQLRHRCAWAGCTRTTKDLRLPKGWFWLLLHSADPPPEKFFDLKPGEVCRDAVLCPEHKQELNSLLIPLPPRLRRGH